MNVDISVVIPLYNKEREIGRTLRSVLAQTLPPREVIVVDDGSTDGSAAAVEAAASPLIRLVRQPNAGVAAARNRGMREARSEWVALLDGDDVWHEGYLAEIARLIDRYPGCGAYATAFGLRTAKGLTPAPVPEREGIVDFFRESMTRYVLTSSSATLRRTTALAIGGFPEGMKIGEDQHFWIRMARTAPVCFSPALRVEYLLGAQNRSKSIYTPERTEHTFEELYDPAASEAYNAYVARAALGRALVICAKGGNEEAARTACFFARSRANRRILRKIRILNALPRPWRMPLFNAYNRLAWLAVRKGF